MLTAITPTNTNSLECTKLLFLEDFAQQALQVQAGIYGAAALQLGSGAFLCPNYAEKLI